MNNRSKVQRILANLIIRSAILAAILFTCFPMTSVFAENVISEISAEQTQALLEDMGFSTTTEKKADGVTLLKFTQQGYKVALYLSKENSSFQFRVYFNDNPGLIKVNEWNRSYNYGRVYLREDNSGINYASDMSLVGGVSDKSIRQFISRNNTILGKFKEFMLVK